MPPRQDLQRREDQFKEHLDEAETYIDEMSLRSGLLFDADALLWNPQPPALKPAASRIHRVAR